MLRHATKFYSALRSALKSAAMASKPHLPSPLPSTSTHLPHSPSPMPTTQHPYSPNHLPPHNPLLLILGATGTGKSQLAITLARTFNGEIINSDAMQLYDGLPIITNKVTVEEQMGVKHHLLGEVGLGEEAWRVGVFKKRVGGVVREIRSRGRLPVVVGGTGYYLQGLLDGRGLLGEDVEEGNGSEGEGEGEEGEQKFPILDGPTEDMVKMLQEVDPVMAQRWHPRDRRKIRRSLEIWLRSGRRASEVYEEQKFRKEYSKLNNGVETEEDNKNNILDAEEEKNSPLLFWVHSEDSVLKTRLDNRVDKMVSSGLLSEVETMDEFLHSRTRKGIKIDRTQGIWVSIGFKEFEPWLRAKADGTEEKDLRKLYNEAIEKMKAATRQYAKRQVRWIRLKLIPLLQEENLLPNLYLLDGTDISRFRTEVEKKAVALTGKFLKGEGMETNWETGEQAKLVLSPENLGAKPDVWFRRTCERCGITAVTDVQWRAHLEGRRHRGRVRKEMRGEWRKGLSE